MSSPPTGTAKKTERKVSLESWAQVYTTSRPSRQVRSVSQPQSSRFRAKPEEEYTLSASVSPPSPLPSTNCRFSTDPSSFSRQT